MFTIEVKKKKKDEEFSFKDLEMFHKDCMGGRILVSTQKTIEERIYLTMVSLSIYVLKCKRCGKKIGLDMDSCGTECIVKTAIDGQEREIKGFIFRERNIFKLGGINAEPVFISVILKN